MNPHLMYRSTSSDDVLEGSFYLTEIMCLHNKFLQIMAENLLYYIRYTTVTFDLFPCIKSARYMAGMERKA